MQVSKIVVALIAAVGFASASFAQSAAPAAQPAPEATTMTQAPVAGKQKAKPAGKKVMKHKTAKTAPKAKAAM